MNEHRRKNVAASIRARLYNVAKRDRQDFNALLTAFAIERFLYRVNCSKYSASFILKGARLFSIWLGSPARPTRDLDLLGLGDSSPGALREVFRAICLEEVEPDGMHFDESTITIEPIRAEQEYDGHRVKFRANLAQARIPIQIDVGFGDVVTPAPQKIEYVGLLDGLPVATVLAYTQETVIAEKLHAIISLDILNTRMKDFYDIAVLSSEFNYDGTTLSRAIQSTFARRRTPVPTDMPACLSAGFADHEDRQRLWRGFLTRTRLDADVVGDFSNVLESVRRFLLPPTLAASGMNPSFSRNWSPTAGWHSPSAE